MEGTKEGYAGGRVPLLLWGGCFAQKIFPLSPIARFSGCWEKRAAGGTFPSKLSAGDNKSEKHHRLLKAININIALSFTSPQTDRGNP